MKKMSKKGFTLVELLAVIVILAVIAVIAVPQVLKIIEGARQDAFVASARSALKGIELKAAQDTTGGDLTGDLSALDINNNPFKGGTWHYDSTTKKIYLYEARYNTAIKDSKYVITGDQEEINSGTAVIAKPQDNNPNLLANKIKDATLGGTTEGYLDEPTGYVKGINPNNYVNLKVGGINVLFRAVKVFDDKSVLMITDDVIDTDTVTSGIQGKAYDNDFDWNYITCDAPNCFNNFAKADIKEYLNTTFYNTVTNKKLLKYNNWNTKLSANGIDYSGDPALTIAKVGLLTLNDYLTVAEVGVSETPITGNYLKKSSWWWLGTGDSLYPMLAWSVLDDGSTYRSYVGDGECNYGTRPAVVLNYGIPVTGTGTPGAPYTVE